MQKFRQILRTRRQLELMIGILLILILLGLMVSLTLDTHVSANQGTTLKLSRVIPLDSWFKPNTTGEAYVECEDEDCIINQALEKSLSPLAQQAHREIKFQHHAEGKIFKIVVDITLWQTDRTFLVFSLEAKPEEPAVER